MEAKTYSKTDDRATHHGRVEDDPLVRGHGRYIADAPLPNQAYAYFVRSPHAFARIVSVDVSAALKAPGVVGVLTAADLAGVGSIGRHPPLPGRGGKALVMPFRPALAAERVMHVGEPLAMVVAETAAAAQDAAELVAVDYETLTPVTDARAALGEGAPQLWPQAPGNLAVDWPGPAADPEANARTVETLFASAKFVAKIAVMNQRMVINSMEPRGATASYDAASDSYTMRACSQSAGTLRENILGIMNLPKERVRVITEDVGGAFGLKTGAYPENIALLVGAKKFGRPIHWMSSRSEAFVSDNQARDTYSDIELALDEKGKFLALRIRNVCNVGAYLGSIGADIPTLNFYPLPARHVRHQAYRHQRQMRFHQHAADRTLSRRRQAGSKLRAGARGRRSGAYFRHRSDQAAPAQSDQKVGHALQDAGGNDLRQRRFRADPRPGAGARRLRRASSSAGARRKNAENIGASASAARWNIPAARPPKPRC